MSVFLSGLNRRRRQNRDLFAFVIFLDTFRNTVQYYSLKVDMSSTTFQQFHQMKNKFNNELILNRIKSHYKFKWEYELANFLQIGETTLSNWRKRDSIDIKKIITFCEDLNPNWIINGMGKPTKTYDNLNESEMSITLEKTDPYESASVIDEVNRLTKIVALQEETINAQIKTIAVMEQLIARRDREKDA